MADARVPGGVLSHGHLFGLKSDVKSNVHFVEEHLVVYPCGHNVVFLHLETRAQQVIDSCCGTADVSFSATYSSGLDEEHDSRCVCRFILMYSMLIDKQFDSKCLSLNKQSLLAFLGE